MLRFTGAVAIAIATLPLLAVPASADTTGYAGIVAGPEGQPIAGACLTLFNGPTQPEAEFCTDEQGRYAITGMPTETSYKIRVTAAGYRTQWWYDAPDFLNADSTWVPANDLIERDITLGRGAGAFVGRITDEHGAPDDATITVRGVDRSFEAIAYTWDFGTDGRYELGNLAPGRYQISIEDNRRGTQWVPQQDTPENATVFELADGDRLTVDEQWLGYGSVEISVADADTGAPVARPCIYIHSTPQDRQACGTDGIVRIDDVPPGWWSITVSAHPGYFPTGDDEHHIDVVRGQVARQSYELVPGAAATTTVIDAATGDPVPGICVRTVWPGSGGQSARAGSAGCSDDTGRLNIGPYDGAYTFQLFAWQPLSQWVTPEKYWGAQWVTADGGSGDQRDALSVTLQEKRTITLPTIKVDPPGSITGVVRDAATGSTISGVCTYPYAFNANQGAIFGRNCSNADGRFTIEHLGPYRWPVEYTPAGNSGYAWQWSGDVADRFGATMIQVTAGGAATAPDARLVPGGVLTGKVTRGDGVVDLGYVWTYQARTGDVASASFVNITRDGTFTLRGHRTQDVHVEYWDDSKGCFYGAADGPPPRKPRLRAVAMVAGQTTTLAMDMSTTCAARPAGWPPPRRPG
jgi:hypothetical protein